MKLAELYPKKADEQKYRTCSDAQAHAAGLRGAARADEVGSYRETMTGEPGSGGRCASCGQPINRFNRTQFGDWCRDCV